MERTLTVIRQLSSARKRVAIAVLVTFILLVYWAGWRGRGRTQWRDSPAESPPSPATCLKDRVASFLSDAYEFDAYVLPESPAKPLFLPYVGNGEFGLEVSEDSSTGGVLWLPRTRSLGLLTSVRPLARIVLPSEHGEGMSKWAMHYRTGIVHVYTCYPSGVYVAQHIYAHRKHTNLLVQEIRISNPTSSYLHVTLLRGNISQSVLRGEVNVSTWKVDSVHSLYTATKSGQNSLGIPEQDTTTTVLLTGISDSTEEKAANAIRSVAKMSATEIMEAHAQSWQKLWSTGFRIQTSKALHTINGNQINATLYYVLSQVAWDGNEEVNLESSEGCYGKHHTLDADTLWPELNSIYTVNSAVGHWLLTLDKHGCHRMIKLGAFGVAQAFVLSLGGLRFSNKHLELNVDPRQLVREWHFRRVHYGTISTVNITIEITEEENKPMLHVAIDNSKASLMGCDAGCLDRPVTLSRAQTAFPVKLTQPLSPILYIAPDRAHLQELRSAIHVREVALAPALEHHVVALHRHGTPLGGLPTFFWVTVSTLIVIFHLFLAKLIYNEYCSSNSSSSFSYSSTSSTGDRYKNVRYGKL